MMEPTFEMDAELLKKIIEGALFAAGQPLNIEQLGFLFDEAERPDNATLRATLEVLMQEYAGRGIELREVASGFRFQVRQETGPWVSRLWEEKPTRYSRALLETLALIAYRQPITRSEIEEIRGVSVSSHIIKTLLERDWIRVAGHRDVPGRPALFATTRDFLDSFNLKSLAELPSLAEIRDLDKINEELELLEAQNEGRSLEAEQLAGVMADLEEADEQRGSGSSTPEDEIYE
jgi:segregation and condensation protein B